MYPPDPHTMVKYHTQVLRREAEQMRLATSAPRKKQTRLGYLLLDLPIPTDYDAWNATLAQAQAYDWLRSRTKAIIWQTALISTSLGMIIACLLGRGLGFVLTLWLGCIVAVLVMVPFGIRSALLLRQRLSIVNANKASLP